MITLTRKHTRLLAGTYAGGLAVLSLLPSQSGPLDGWDSSIEPSVQNLLHVPAYVVLTGLVLLSAGSGQFVAKRAPLLLAGTCVVFGALLEGVQTIIPGRSASLSDGVLNVLGVLGGLAAWRFGISRRCLPHRIKEAGR